jgi:hypothetical protein
VASGTPRWLFSKSGSAASLSWDANTQNNLPFKSAGISCHD